jgi:hypothetical protein
MRGARALSAVKLACLSAAITVATATPALAKPKEEPLPPEQAPAVSSATLSPDTAAPGGAASPQLAIGGCWGETQLPHPSYSFASVHARTTCPFTAPLVVSVNLLRDRWYGWENMANGYRSGTTTAVDGFAKWYCAGAGTYTYEGSSYHRATVNGTNLIAYTANQARFAC